jgi:demethylmenaquinone methyltransferase/2-methoxy-6-polyprenyl-1,4-benzoquinol methylase
MSDAPYSKPLWMTEGDEKRARVKGMFAQLASRYDLLNSLFCFRLHYRWRTIAVEKLCLQAGDQVVDVCSGTGSFIAPLFEKVGVKGTVLALDFCVPMLQIAFRRESARARFAAADALALPVASGSFDGFSVGWGIRNIVDIDAAHREAYRVLKPEKRFVSVDMAQPRNAAIRWISRMLFATVVPMIAGLFGHGAAYMYLPKSTEKFKSREELAESMQRAGFSQVEWQDLMFGNVCVHWGLKV